MYGSHVSTYKWLIVTYLMKWKCKITSRLPIEFFFSLIPQQNNSPQSVSCVSLNKKKWQTLCVIFVIEIKHSSSIDLYSFAEQNVIELKCPLEMNQISELCYVPGIQVNVSPNDLFIRVREMESAKLNQKKVSFCWFNSWMFMFTHFCTYTMK